MVYWVEQVKQARDDLRPKDGDDLLDRYRHVATLVAEPGPDAHPDDFIDWVFELEPPRYGGYFTNQGPVMSPGFYARGGREEENYRFDVLVARNSTSKPTKALRRAIGEFAFGLLEDGLTPVDFRLVAFGIDEWLMLREQMHSFKD